MVVQFKLQVGVSLDGRRVLKKLQVLSKHSPVNIELWVNACPSEI
jgi:hypothetical protein